LVVRSEARLRSPWRDAEATAVCKANGYLSRTPDKVQRGEYQATCRDVVLQRVELRTYQQSVDEPGQTERRYCIRFQGLRYTGPSTRRSSGNNCERQYSYPPASLIHSRDKQFPAALSWE